MGLRRDYDENDEHSFSEFYPEEEMNAEGLKHKKHIRKRLEDRLERKRLKAEFDELDGEFDWEDFDK